LAVANACQDTVIFGGPVHVHLSRCGTLSNGALEKEQIQTKKYSWKKSRFRRKKLSFHENISTVPDNHKMS